jgi:UDP-2,4-diacetamido-2,4,6-trideoxy-beta-L-altropyranose hydrolase
MRSIALGQAWRRAGGTTAFAVARCSAALLERIRSSGFPIHQASVEPGSSADANWTRALAAQLRATWVATDGYHFADAYGERVTAGGHRLLAIDDYGHAEHAFARLILNQNLSARIELYPDRGAGREALLGPQFALLRDEFLAHASRDREFAEVGRHVLVTMGGSDPPNATATVLRALLGHNEFEIKAVVGGSYAHPLPHPDVIRDATNMADLMAWADLAIAAGGTSAWELAFMGVPSVTLVLADNQLDIAASLEKHGLSRNIGRHGEVGDDVIVAAVADLAEDVWARRRMSDRGRAVVDGKGRDRVVDRMLSALDERGVGVGSRP